MAFGALPLLSPHFQPSFYSATSPVSTLVFLSIWMMYYSFYFCPLFFPSLCSRLPQPERLRWVREGGKQSRQTGVVVAWKGHSKAPRRSQFSVCTILAHVLQPQAGSDGEVSIRRHKLLWAEAFPCITPSIVEQSRMLHGCYVARRSGC